MIEIFNCIYLTILFLFLFRLSFIDNIKENCMEIKKFTLVEKYSLNILITFIIFLFASFFEFNYLFIIYFLIFLNLFSILNIKKNFLKIKYIEDSFPIIFILTFIISINIISNLKLEWDGHFWYLKALNFYENYNFFNLKNISHNTGYPHLGGFVWGLFWKVSILDNEFFGRMIFVFLYVISILIIAENITNKFSLKILVTLVLLFFTFDNFLFGGYQEYLLFSLIVIIFNLLNKLDLKKLNFFNLFLIIFSSYLLVWTKNEGIFYFIAIMLYIIYYQPLNKKFFLIFALISLFLLRMYLFSKITGDYSITRLSFDISYFDSFKFNLSDFLIEIFIISKHIIIAFFKYPIWLLIFFSLFLKKIDNSESHIKYFTFFSVIFVYSIFLNTTQDLVWHLSVTLDRVLFQLSAFYMIFLSLRLRYFCKKFYK